MKTGIRAIDILTKGISNKNISFYSESLEHSNLLLLSIAIHISQFKEVTIIHDQNNIEDYIISNILKKDLSEVKLFKKSKKDNILKKIKSELSINILKEKNISSLNNFKGSLFIINLDKKVKDIHKNLNKMVAAYPEEVIYSFSHAFLGDWCDSTNFIFALRSVKEKSLQIESIKGGSYKNSINIPKYKNTLLHKQMLEFKCVCGALNIYGEKAKRQSFLHDDYCEYLILF